MAYTDGIQRHTNSFNTAYVNDDVKPDHCSHSKKSEGPVNSFDIPKNESRHDTIDDDGIEDHTQSRRHDKPDYKQDNKKNEIENASADRTHDAIDRLNEDGNIDEDITMDSLKNISKNEGGKYNKGSQDAASYLLQHKSEFKKVATSASDNPDTATSEDQGSISAKDRDSYLGTTHHVANDQNTKQASTDLKDFAAKDTDKKLSYDELRTISKDKKVDAKTREAAQYFVDNKSEFTKVESSGGTKGEDNLIEADDLAGASVGNSHRKASDASTKDASEKMDALFKDNPDRSIKMDDLRKEAVENSDESVRNAAQYFVDNQGEFDKAESAADNDTNRHDGVALRADFKKAATK